LHRRYAAAPFAAYLLLGCSLALAQEHIQPGVVGDGVLWTDPGDIRSRNLYWGPGGEDRQPQLPVEFLQEDRHGTSPKFDVRDSAGTKWRAKLGIEAGPEVVASRLLWAVGYSANETTSCPICTWTNCRLIYITGKTWSEAAVT
jgi:hypothetical protein